MVPAVGAGGDQGRGAPSLALPHMCRVCLGGCALPKGKGGAGAGRAPRPHLLQEEGHESHLLFSLYFSLKKKKRKKIKEKKGGEKKKGRKKSQVAASAPIPSEPRFLPSCEPFLGPVPF